MTGLSAGDAMLAPCGLLGCDNETGQLFAEYFPGALRGADFWRLQYNGRRRIAAGRPSGINAFTGRKFGFVRRFRGLSERLGRLAGRFGRFSRRFGRFSGRFRGLSRRFGGFAGWFGRFSERLGRFSRRFGRLAGRWTGLIRRFCRSERRRRKPTSWRRQSAERVHWRRQRTGRPRRRFA